MRDDEGARVVLPGGGPSELLGRALAGVPAEAHVWAVAQRVTPGPGRTLLLAGDAPLLTVDTVDTLVRRHRELGTPATVLVGEPDDAGGDWLAAHCATRSRGVVVAAVLEGPTVDHRLDRLVERLAAAGHVVSRVTAADWRDTVRITDAASHSWAAQLLRDRIVRRWMLDGVLVVDPASTWIDATVTLEAGAVIEPRTRLAGHTTVAAGAWLGPDVSLLDTTVGAAARVRTAVCEGTEIGPDAEVGPYTYLRVGTRLGPRTGAGCFVEMKGTVVGAGTMVPHFACLIDGDVGERCNIAAFTGLANFDGVRKQRAVIGDDVLVASGTAVMAPARLGDGSVTAAGTVVTKDVPPGALAIARVSQVNVDGWVEARMPGTRYAQAARRAQGTNGKSVE
ncbi:bifunctional UDP-N-acetylglucosamine diphosphorylase/glucosamine-1-phosphate N-acetyltransferase GlmU [Asanoa sp. WMMD1127]|uniref:bifunctional UDP-N-acetylglucosamine diphosphorylase/glucosamine-1-phosphate N-acetyltransferase GlmU n=1 Tax=Asanoa sp. WMMD1127 TaxID=3016107 RepID=UPI002415E20C|nr:bifunctional UDP-N-acetylglucosamine diphosphorylase/glucosamine-1-phosphate N-acetyltransferase GlmU [Asanoa sp. WMMD1127]MDG4820748.1 bifunctional UDP-N-acetylglucosamine diphosphorylase/glucosamine-1-phosphate N-acetyltransferase GlmU [Asanoa sp. WMMD1127]